MSSTLDDRYRAGWGAPIVASVLGLAVALGIFAVRAAARPVAGEVLGWPIVVAMPLCGGLAAGARFPRDRSAAVASGLLLGAWLGAIALHLGLAAAFGHSIASPAAGWIVFSIGWLFVSFAAAGVGSLIGSTVAGVWHGRRAAGDTTDGPMADGAEVPLRRIGRAILEGAGVMGTVAVGGLFVGPLAVLFGAPFAGGFVAGGRSPGGAAIGAICGLLAGFAYVVTLLVLFVLWLRSLTWASPGIGLVIVGYVLALLLAIALSGIGGLLGGLTNDSGDDSEAQDGETPVPSES